MTLFFANLFIWPAALIGESPFTLPVLPITWIGLAWLGLLGSCTAYLLYFFLINTWGATRASVVTYIFPVVGLFLGLIFLQEAFDLPLGIGSLLVVAGVVVLNWKKRKQLIPASAVASVEGQ
jgi:drug/metabolite transporter (DMT)-like permease